MENDNMDVVKVQPTFPCSPLKFMFGEKETTKQRGETNKGNEIDFDKMLHDEMKRLKT